MLDGVRILVVEDDEMLREVICECLADYGAEVISAENGVKALELALAQNFNVILSDVRMPGGDGIQFLSKLTAHQPQHPPFYFVTGFADLKEVEAIQRGATGMFLKPFNFVDLAAELQRWQIGSQGSQKVA